MQLGRGTETEAGRDGTRGTCPLPSCTREPLSDKSAALLRHDRAHGGCSPGARHGSTPSCAHTGAGVAQGSPPPLPVHRQQRCPGAAVTTGDALPALSACRGTPRTHAEPKLRERHPRTHGGIRAGIPRTGLPLPCAHTRCPASSPPSPAGSAAGLTGAHTPRTRCCTGAAAGGTSPLHPGKPRRSAPPAAGSTPGGERHRSGGAGGSAAGGQQAGGVRP